MTDPNVTPDPTQTSSFENAAIDPAAAAAQGMPADVTGTVDEQASENEEVGMVTSALAREVQEQKDKYLRLFAEFENYRKRAVRERQEAELKGMQFLLARAIPNFYFHVTTAYDILRHNGLDVGKKDFLGNTTAS